MTVQLSPLAVQRFVDNNGNALAGGQLYTYQAGTSTPQPTYTDSTGLTANTNPIVLNARGEANVWLTSGQAYKFALYDSLNNLIWTVDNIIDTGAALAANLASTSDMTLGVALVGGAPRVVASIAALRTLPKTGSPQAFVTGYYAQGDGGGGTYWYNSADTTSSDNGGTIIVASDGGRWYLSNTRSRLFVEQFGAKVDGATNDTTAVSAARAIAQAGGGEIFYGGVAAGGTDTRALATETVLGSSSAYATGLTAQYPVVHQQIYNATPTPGAGYSFYGTRLDLTTKTGVNVQSAVGFASVVQ